MVLFNTSRLIRNFAYYVTHMIFALNHTVSIFFYRIFFFFIEVTQKRYSDEKAVATLKSTNSHLIVFHLLYTK